TPSTSRAETVLRRRGEATTRTGIRPFSEPPSRSPVVMRPYAYHLRSGPRGVGTHLSARRPPARVTLGRGDGYIYQWAVNIYWRGGEASRGHRRRCSGGGPGGARDEDHQGHRGRSTPASRGPSGSASAT